MSKPLGTPRAGSASGTVARNFGHGFEKHVEDRVDVATFDFRIETEEDAVAEGGVHGAFQVFELDVGSPGEHGVPLGSEDDGLCTAGACAESDVVEVVACFDESSGVVEAGVGDGGGAQAPLQGEEFVAREDHAGRFGFTARGGVENLDEGGRVGPGDVELEEEAVELCFREGVGALHFDGVLRGEYEEWVRQVVSFATGGDDAFLHGFEEGRLRLGGGAVDFVGEEDVREDGSGPKLEGAVMLAVHAAAGHVGGHEVGRELDASEGEVGGRGEGANEARLSEPRSAFDEDVAACERGNEEIVDEGLLPEDDGADGLREFACAGGDDFGCGFVGGCHLGLLPASIPVGVRRLERMETSFGRVQLRPLSSLSNEDWRRLHAHFRDAEISYLNGTPPNRMPMWLLRRVLRMDARRPDREAFGIFDEVGSYIGTAELYDVRGDVATLGIIIGEKTHWNQGYGPEAIHALLGYAFRELGLRLVELKTYADNLRAQAAFRKVGFREVRRMPAREGRTDVLMEIGRDAWLADQRKRDGVAGWTAE